ncbi:MAG TPA: type I-U CRISPR-associated protein Cas7 [Verrucomicrobiae bacterium]
MNNNAFEFGGFTVPAGCRRIFITAQLEPSNGDPRIQPTGFPDVGPVYYPDPNTDRETTKGLICLIQSEPAMANLLEEVCLADKYVGTLKEALGTLPYLKVTADGKPDGEFKTSSTIDGHRFASEYLMKSKGKFEEDHTDEDLVDFVKRKLRATGTEGDSIPAANVPNIFRLAMELDPLSLIHGFQVSIKNRLTFVGLRSPRALTACILGYRCEQRVVPGVRFDPIGTGDAGQAIFQKERLVAKDIEAQFAIDVGLLETLRLASDDKKELRKPRVDLLVGLSLWKVATLLSEFEIQRSLRTECKLRLKAGSAVKYTCDGRTPDHPFDYKALVDAKSSEDGGKHQLHDFIKKAELPKDRSPLTLKFYA